MSETTITEAARSVVAAYQAMARDRTKYTCGWFFQAMANLREAVTR